MYIYVCLAVFPSCFVDLVICRPFPCIVFRFAPCGQQQLFIAVLLLPPEYFFNRRVFIIKKQYKI